MSDTAAPCSAENSSKLDSGAKVMLWKGLNARCRIERHNVSQLSSLVTLLDGMELYYRYVHIGPRGAVKRTSYTKNVLTISKVVVIQTT